MPKTIFVDNTDLTRDKSFSTTTEDVFATGTTMRIASIAGFHSVTTSSGQIVCVGKIGDERTELLRTSNSSGYKPSPTYKEITFRDSMLYDHPQDTPVWIVDWNRVDIQHAATVTGSKSTIVASPSYPIYIDPTQTETQYKDTVQTSGFYFTRFNETVGDTNSDWSDAIPYSGYDANMVASVKRRALEELGEQIDGNMITHEFLNECLWEARREYHTAPGKRPFRRKFNSVIGTALTGSFRIEAPSDLERGATAENVYGIRIGENANMSYYDKKEWDFDWQNKPRSFLTTAYNAGVDQDLYVNSVRDFEDEGAVTIEGATVSYSAKGISGGTLRISTHGDWDASVGSTVHQNATYGLPSKFTVFADPGGSSYIYFNRAIDTAYVNMNIYADYYRTLLGYDSDADSLDEPKYSMYVPYLKAKIKHRKSKGEMDLLKDPDYILWVTMKNEALKSEIISTDIKLVPDVWDVMPE